MFERFTRKSLAATAGALLAAMGVGGAALAQSAPKTRQPAAPAAVSQPKEAAEVPGQESNAAENSATDSDNIQSGDQTAPESGTERESGSEKVNDDGPGGHADEPGNPNADHQFQGKE